MIVATSSLTVLCVMAFLSIVCLLLSLIMVKMSLCGVAAKGGHNLRARQMKRVRDIILILTVIITSLLVVYSIPVVVYGGCIDFDDGRIVSSNTTIMDETGTEQTSRPAGGVRNTSCTRDWAIDGALLQHLQQISKDVSTIFMYVFALHYCLQLTYLQEIDNNASLYFHRKRSTTLCIIFFLTVIIFSVMICLAAIEDKSSYIGEGLVSLGIMTIYIAFYIKQTERKISKKIAVGAAMSHRPKSQHASKVAPDNDKDAPEDDSFVKKMTSISHYHLGNKGGGNKSQDAVHHSRVLSTPANSYVKFFNTLAATMTAVVGLFQLVVAVPKMNSEEPYFGTTDADCDFIVFGTLMLLVISTFHYARGMKLWDSISLFLTGPRSSSTAGSRSNESNNKSSSS